MQFTMNVGADYSTVKFNATLKLAVLETLIHHFERLGGVMIGPKASDWTFPSFITSEVIKQVIHNTCFKCGGLMKDEEYHSDHILRKCSYCGHSHT